MPVAMKKERTIDKIKKERKVSEEARENLKTFNRIKKSILEALKEGPRTVPEVAEITGLPTPRVHWYLMTLRRYGEVVAGEQDDMDEYFTYELAKKEK